MRIARVPDVDVVAISTWRPEKVVTELTAAEVETYERGQLGEGMAQEHWHRRCQSSCVQ